MQLLEDVFIVENLQILTEGKTGPMRVRGVFQRADEENNNKRVYGKPLLEREVNKLAEAITERRLMGELDHPQHDSVKLSNVSHLITGLSMKGNEVIGEAEILDTPSGKVAQALIQGGVKVGISSRGMGTVSEDVHGKRHVNEDFRLITWDLVADPSTRGAYPGLTESTQIQEIIDRVLPEAHKVKNFTTLLKESLDESKTEQSSKRKRTVLPGKGPHDLPSRSSGRMSPKQFRKTMAAKEQAKLDVKYKDEPTKAESTSLADLVRSKLYEDDKGKVTKKPMTPAEGKLRQKLASQESVIGTHSGPDRSAPKRKDDSTSLADLVRSRLLETEVPPKDPKRPLAPDPAKQAAAEPKPGPMVQHLKGKRVSQVRGTSDTAKAARRVQRRVRKIVGRKVDLPADVAAQQHTKSQRIKAAQGKQDPIPTDTQMRAAKRRKRR